MYKHKRLYVLDFDGTLVRTPSPDTLIEGVPARQFYDDWLWENRLPRRKWQGWWGRPETLQPPILGTQRDGKLVIDEKLVNRGLVDQVRVLREDPENLVVLATGRHDGMRCEKTNEHLVKQILDSIGLEFHAYHYVNTGVPTIRFKLDRVQEYLASPSITYVEVWEDNLSHISEFYNFFRWWVKRNREVEYRVNAVDLNLVLGEA